MNRQKRLWLRQHGVNERRLAKPIETFLDAQAQRVADAIEQHGYPTPSYIHELLRPHDENAKFLKAVSPAMLRQVALGAHLELTAVERKAADLPDGILAEFDIPANVLRAIRESLDTVTRQPYWLAIQTATIHKLEDIIGNGIAQGTPLREVVGQVQDSLGGAAAKRRAKRIARTETTSSLNCGHFVARQELLREGLIKGSEWLGMADERQRQAHAALDGTTVPAGQLFNVGGELAPYPGYYGLSARQRVNCRCTSVAATTFAD